MKRLLQSLAVFGALSPTGLAQGLLAQTDYPQPADGYGQEMAAGDFNGDSFEDLVIGAPDANGGAGLVLLEISLQNFTVRVPLAPPAGAPSGFGTSVATADFNLDGRDDIVVGAPGGAGAAYVFLGQAGAQTPVLWWSKTGINSDAFGTSVATTPDSDGDSVPEVIVGAPRGGFGGFSTPCNLVAGGYVDLLSGVNGAVLAFYVAPSGTQCCLPNILCGGTSRLGERVVGGDFNGDGQGDVGVQYFLRSGPNPASLWSTNFRFFTYSTVANPPAGSPPGSLAIAQNVGLGSVQSGSPISADLAFAGDVDGDGADDVLAGYVGPPGANAGKVSVLRLNTPTSTLHTETGASSEEFGSVAVGMAEFSGAGRSDIAGVAQDSGQPYLRLVSGGSCNVGAPIDEVDLSPWLTEVSDAVSLDFNGDGRLDVALVDETTGQLRVIGFGGPAATLASAGDTLSLQDGGGGPLFADAGSSASGGLCFMVASGALLSPGQGALLSDGTEFLFPVNDPWLTASLGSSNLLFANNLPALDADGQASIGLELCGIPPMLSTLHFGYFVVQFGAGGVPFTTNASNTLTYTVVP